MTEEEYERVRPVIEMAQRLHNGLYDQLIKRGVEPIDVLIASTYATHEIATKLHGNPIGAIEWMRDALDTIERQVLAKAKPN